MKLYTIDQEVNPDGSKAIVMYDGLQVVLFDLDLAEDGSLVVGDANVQLPRRGRSLSQAWTVEEWLDLQAKASARGIQLRMVNNYAFCMQDGAEVRATRCSKHGSHVPGGRLAVINLWDRCTEDPNWMLSASRPLSNRTAEERSESYRLHDEANWDFRQAEDAQKHGVIHPVYLQAQDVARQVLSADELRLIDQPRPWRGGWTKDDSQRLLLAIAFSVLDSNGQPRLRDNGKPVTARYAQKYIARLHHQGRGAKIGGPIRAALRHIGRGNDPAKRKESDKVFSKLARALLSPTSPVGPIVSAGSPSPTPPVAPILSAKVL